MSSERLNNASLNITSNNLNVSLISSGSIATLGATIGTLYANNITSSNIYVSGSVVTVNVTSVNVIDSNITTGTLNASTGITTGTLLATSTISSASFATPGATVGTLYVTSITSGNVQVSGTVSAGTIAGTLITSSNVQVSGTLSAGTLNTGNATVVRIDVNGSGNSGSVWLNGTRFASDGTISNLIAYGNNYIWSSDSSYNFNVSNRLSAGSIATSGITTGTLYANTISSSNIQISGSISAGTHVGTLFSSASIGASGATVGTLYASTITTSNIKSVSMTSGGIFITAGGLQISNSNLGAFKIITGTIATLAISPNTSISGSFTYNGNHFFSGTPHVTISVIGGSNPYYALACLSSYDTSGGGFYVSNINGTFNTTPVMSYIAIGPA